MRASALAEILKSIDRVDADEGVLEQMRQLVRDVGALHGVRFLGRAGRVVFARRLLNKQVSRSTVKELGRQVINA